MRLNRWERAKRPGDIAKKKLKRARKGVKIR